jgi:hypothetical protein
MSPTTTESVPSLSAGRRRAAPPPGVRLRPDELRRRMQVVGVTGGELARRAKLAKATVSRALKGGRIYPSTVRAIASVLSELEPIPGADGLIDHDGEDPGRVRDA